MITERIDKPSEIKSWPGTIPVHNLYTVGIAGEKFLRAIKDQGKLLAASCGKCQKDFLPPKIFCPYCLQELKEWREVPSRGVVETFTVCNGQIFALIRLTSAGGLIHKLGGVTPGKVKIGLKVEAVFKVPAERKGSLLDIAYFQPC